METFQTPLLQTLFSLIKAEKAITLERFMEIVLHDPDHGYYRQGNPLGLAGDFLTAPEISSLFGEMIGAWCVQSWKALGRPSPFVLLELGPGQGTLMQDALAFTKAEPAFHEAFSLCLLESNRTLRALQQEKLAAYAPKHIEKLEDLPPLPLITVSNEFFDTLPMRQFVRTLFGWRERMVTLAKDALCFKLGKIQRRPPRFIDQTGPGKFPLRGIYEVSPFAQKVVSLLSTHIATHGGAGLIIDYGYTDPPPMGTLDALHGQRFVDVFTKPGQTDVTAGVDFAALARIAQNHDGIVANIMKQGPFLQRMGVMERALFLKNALPKAEAYQIDQSLSVLVNRSQMGKFNVLEFLRPRN